MPSVLCRTDGNSNVLNRKNNLSPQVKNYFDYQATTPVDRRVLDEMNKYLEDNFGNPHSRNYALAWNAEKAVDESREKIANLIKAKDKSEIIFTSGATESDNLAIKGFCEYHNYDLHVITVQTEHKAVLETCRYLEKVKGVKVTYLPVNDKGKICIKDLKKAITPKTKLMSIMAINNETGVCANLEAIGKVCKDHNITLHTDAAQAFGKISLDVNKLNIGMMSISGHKIYCPKGIGALYVRKYPANQRVRLTKQIHGGDQERGLRSGTVPVFLTVGLGKAAEIAKAEGKAEFDKLTKFKTLFLKELTKKLGPGDFIINGKQSIPGCLNISFPYIEGEGMLMKLKGFALSSGSACTSASLEPSFVLRAMGRSDDLAHSSLRIGFGRFTTEADVLNLVDKISKAVKELQALSPLYEMAKAGVDMKTIKWTA